MSAAAPIFRERNKMAMLLPLLLLVSGEPAIAPPAQTAGKDRLICKTISLTGSRLAKKRTCKTSGDWALLNAEQRQKARELIDRPIIAPCREGRC